MLHFVVLSKGYTRPFCGKGPFVERAMTSVFNVAKLRCMGRILYVNLLQKRKHRGIISNIFNGQFSSEILECPSMA